MIEPLKYINSTSLISFNLLHIRSVYIENGIPKREKITSCSSGLISRLKFILVTRISVRSLGSFELVLKFFYVGVVCFEFFGEFSISDNYHCPRENTMQHFGQAESAGFYAINYYMDLSNSLRPVSMTNTPSRSVIEIQR